MDRVAGSLGTDCTGARGTTYSSALATGVLQSMMILVMIGNTIMNPFSRFFCVYSASKLIRSVMLGRAIFSSLQFILGEDIHSRMFVFGVN